MNRLMKIGLTALMGIALCTTDADAGYWRRRTYRYVHPQHTVTRGLGKRVEGHTEATGTGTAIDGLPPHVHRQRASTAKPAVRVEGHTEATGTGTAVDGR